MYDVLPAWAKRALRVDHGVVARVWSSVNGSSFTVPLKLAEGSGAVRVDGRNFVRRTFAAEIVADVASPAVSPFVAELRVEYGIIVGLQTAWVTVGTFVIDTVEESKPGVVKVSCRDRAQRILDARLEVPITTSGSTVAAISSLVTGADYRITFTDHTGSAATHSTTLWERDRDKAVSQLADSIGAVLIFAPDGSAHLWGVPALPTAGSPGTWSVSRGTGGGKVSSARAVSRAGTYNAFVVIGEAPDGSVGVTSVARDTGLDSPTRYGGPFGKKTRFFRSSMVTTQAAADTAAAAGLARAVGQPWSLDLTGLPNPTLEPTLDTLRAEVAPGRFETHVLDAYDLPLSPRAVRYETRTTAAAVEGE